MRPVHNITSTNNNRRAMQGLSTNVIRFGTGATTPAEFAASSSHSFGPLLIKRRKLNPKQQELERLQGIANRRSLLSSLPARHRQCIEHDTPEGYAAGDAAQWIDLPEGEEPPDTDSDDDPAAPALNKPDVTYNAVSDALHGPTYASRMNRKRHH